MKKIVIAIDGYASCGKSTIAKNLAKALDYIFIDTGAMYRATTLFFLDQGIDFASDGAHIAAAMERIRIHFEQHDGQTLTYLNGQCVEQDIRSMRVAEAVSPVATLATVRRAMVAQQQAMGRTKGVVLDGRDIGTVVFPDAELKLFVTADIDVRTARRVAELTARGIPTDAATVQTNLLERDRIDSTRTESPLRQADDAIVLDTTHLSMEEQLNKAFQLALARIQLAEEAL